MDPIKIAILEDNAETRQALAYILNTSPGLSCVGASGRGEEALEQFPPLKPDLVLLDVQLPGISGLECLRRIAPLLPQSQFMMLTVLEDYDTIFEALRSGATGYLLKSSPPGKIVESLRELHAGGSPISSQIARQIITAFRGSPVGISPAAGPSPVQTGAADPETGAENIRQHPDLSGRESVVLHWLAKGYLYKEVAQELGISPGTVRTHVQRIYRKLHVRSKTEAAAKLTR